MSCRKFQRFLHLNRPGELNAREQRELDAHLETCPRCAGVWQRNQAIEARMELLRQNVPVVSAPQELTDNIMAGIQNKSHRRAQPVTGTVLSAWIRLFEPSLPRRAAAVICFGMICLFVGQHMWMLSEVRGLERDLARAPHAAAGFSPNYILSTESWEELEKDLGNGVTRQVLARFIQRKGNQIYLAERPLRRLMVKYRDRQIRRVRIAAKLLEQNPNLREKLEPLLKQQIPGVRPWLGLEQHGRKQP